MELASYPELLIILFALGLVAAEIFFLPTGGWLAIMGVGIGMVGLVLAFMPDATQFNPGSEDWSSSLGKAFANSFLALLAGAGGIVALLLSLPKLAISQKLASVAEITATSASDGTAITNANPLIGQRGVARSDLTPNGFIIIDEREMSAQAQHGEFVKAGTAVKVVAMRFGEAIVQVDEQVSA
jgi:membrane-bound ClpP family serine protease